MATKKPTKKATKKGSKSYPAKAQAVVKAKSKISAGKSEDPIIIRGGGSVRIEFNNKTGKFKNLGGGKHRHPTANLVSVSVNGTLVATLKPADVVSIKLA
jgi:hypothetical protein